MVAILSSAFGFANLDIAEDIVQETLLAAFNHWSYGALPDNPEAWLMRVAKNKALNYVKHEQRAARIHRRIAAEAGEEETTHIGARLGGDIDDAVLRLIFACCHPAIAEENQIALILKTLAGFGSGEIARALLITEDAVDKRLYRAKQAIVRQNIRLDVPAGDELVARLEVVCTTLYLLYNEGYNATQSETAIRRDLCLEAMRLCRLLSARFPQRTEVFALAALMCFHSARFESRLDDKGALIIFEEQDRGLWDRELIDIGMYHLTESARGDVISSYHLEASIAAQHCIAPSFEETDWKFIRTLYQRLFELKPNPIIELNLAIVESKIGGAGASIAKLEELRGDKKLARYALLHATLGELYRQRGRRDEALASFRVALSHTRSPQEEAFLGEKVRALMAGAVEKKS